MRLSLSLLAKKTGLAVAALLWPLAGAALGAAPTITSATRVDLYYDAGNAADGQFAYRIAATDAPTTFEATGLPPDATLNRTTGWINGSRNVPGVYDVAVRASNANGVGTATVRLAIHPAATGVRSSGGVFRAGQDFSFTVNYNAPVTVTGTPRLALVIGPAGAPAFKDAVYVSGSGTSELVFQYVVELGDEDLDGVQVLPKAPFGGAICDASGLTASPSLPVRYFVSGITISAEVRAAAVTSAVIENTSAIATSTRLVNVSSRMRVAEGDAGRSLIAGFVISGSSAKRVLLRAIGPALGGFGVQGALADPRLQLFASTGGLVVENDNWSGPETSAAAGALGAFKLSDGARDSAVVVILQPGAYTLVVMPNGGDGVALAEVYDADAGTAVGEAEIVNLSTRGRVDGGEGALIAGFTVKGSASRRVLVRGIGPALAKFGVTGVLEAPTLTVFQGDRLVAQNDGWQAATAAEVSAASAASGAFALEAGSKDAAVVLTLAPGSYSAVVSGAGGLSGAALVEVYELAAGV